ncbi:hypothetical protein [Priestia megaterium]|uniref:hypothetical protein n=1 Tax=Priestia megaterium TaxID=1404 RepID=UPI0012B7F9BF|nr:hypothetical protein [Priestia megaterium]
MSYEVKQINPTQCTFTYNLGEYDCYELRKGVCSLYLSEAEALEISKEEGNFFGDGNVMHCRNLAKSLLKADYYNNITVQEEDYSIRMHPRDCGHYVFTDGQHRTCIAKHLNLQSMYACVESHEIEEEIKCRACYDKIEKEVESESILNKIFSRLNLNGKNSHKGFRDFIDDERMNFNKTSFFIEENVRFKTTGVKKF